MSAYDQEVTYSYRIKRKLVHIMAHKGTLVTKKTLAWRTTDREEVFESAKDLKVRLRWKRCPNYVEP
jgi:hypothetical protein